MLKKDRVPLFELVPAIRVDHGAQRLQWSQCNIDQARCAWLSRAVAVGRSMQRAELHAQWLNNYCTC